MSIPKNNADPDKDIVQKAAEGSEAAFEEIVHKYQQAVFNTIYRYTGYADEVEDLAQEVFIKVWRNLKKFRGKSRFSTWLYRITVNHCLSYRRKHRHSIVSLDESAEHNAVPESLQVNPDWEQKRRIELVKKAIDELPKRQRMAFVLAHYEGRSYQEIAEIMKVSRSSVESLIFRARTALRKKFGRKENEK